ncbi:hypothetical protein L1887_21932 [Cichorium endivia]|nr:hypothetical protein L1887_21932 [Cichorium endivia]
MYVRNYISLCLFLSLSDLVLASYFQLCKGNCRYGLEWGVAALAKEEVVDEAARLEEAVEELSTVVGAAKEATRDVVAAYLAKIERRDAASGGFAR